MNGLLMSLFFFLAHAHHCHEEFQWSDEKSEYADIQVEVAGPGTIQKLAVVTGKILAHPDHVAYVTAKVDGTVYLIQKNVGDNVEKGETLAVIESQKLAEAKSHYLMANCRLNLQKKFLDQETNLKGISPTKDYLEAVQAHDEARLEKECALQQLYSLGFTNEEITQFDLEEPLNRRLYELKSPIQGKILERDIIIGEVMEGSKRAFKVGNFDRVWVEMHIAQDDVRNIKEGLTAEIVTAGGKAIQTKLSQFNPVICEKTRMATAIAEVENCSNQYVPGQYVHASLLTNTMEFPVVVPKEAVQKMKGGNYIFVKCEDNFEPCKVILGQMDEKYVEIISGLHEGDHYVSQNAFCLKADYEKEEVEHSH